MRTELSRNNAYIDDVCCCAANVFKFGKYLPPFFRKLFCKSDFVLQ